MRRPEIFAIAAVTAWITLFWSGPPVNDAAWQLWIGRQLNSGARLYVDILEVNPPLWFWGGALVVQISDIVGMSAFDALKLTFGVVAVVSILLMSPLLGSRERMFTYGALVAALALTSRSAFLQREQFTLITVLPYVILTARRSEEVIVPWRYSLPVGIFAALGLALKHYFVPVPLVLAVWLMWRRGRPMLPPELMALAAAGAIYGAALLLLTPEYVTNMLPLLRLAYGPFEAPISAQVLTIGVSAGIFAVAGIVIAGPPRSAVTQAALLAGSTFFLAYIVQSKGFFYHLVPALGMLSVALAAKIALMPRSEGRTWKAVSAFAAFLSLLIMSAVQTRGARTEPVALRAVAGLPPGATVMMFTASGTSMWPLVEMQGLVWPSRHMFFWMLRAIHSNPDGPGMHELAHMVREQTADDLECTPPDLILLDTRSHLVPGDWLIGFFEKSPRLVAIMREYPRNRLIGPYLALQRSDPVRRSCRSIAFAPTQPG